jgi:K+-sensing histidine kinase KdpD
MRDEHRDRVENWHQQIRERWIALDDAFTGPESPFREVAEFIKGRPLYLRWTTVLLSSAITLMIGLMVQSFMSMPSQLMLALPAVMISAVYGGTIAGAAATFLGATVSIYFFFPQTNLHDRQVATIGLILYFFASALVLLLARSQDRLRKRQAQLALELEDRVSERTDELVQSNKELAGFCYSISHDLRAPMRNIVSSSRILSEDLEAHIDEDAKRRLLGMADSANRLSSLVDDLLGYARLSAAELRVEPIDLSVLVEEICERNRRQNWKIARLSCKIQPGLVAGGDGALISLALRSLVENCFKYARPSQVLTIEFGETRRKKTLWYYLRDNGIGFDMQYAAKIFEPFQRLHRDADVPGTGIGLANVKRIVERHDGEIFAESKLGEGATFYFRLGSNLPSGFGKAGPKRVVMADEA